MEKKEINILTEDNQTKKNDEKKVNEEQKDSKRNSLGLDKSGKKDEKRDRYASAYLYEVLGTTRPVKVTKGGRQFSFTSLVLIKDKEKKGVAYARGRGKETINALQKAYRKAQKKLLVYFPTPPRTIPRDIIVD